MSNGNIQNKITKLIKIKRHRKTVDIRFDLQPLNIKLTDNAVNRLHYYFGVYGRPGNTGGTCNRLCSFRVPAETADEFIQKIIETVTNPKNLVTLED